MSRYEELQDEFSPVKECSIKELDNDSFLLRLGNQNGLVRDVAKQRERQKLNYTFNIKLNRFSRRRDPKPSQNNASSDLNPKRRKVFLVGMEELQKNRDVRKQSLSVGSIAEHAEKVQDQEKEEIRRADLSSDPQQNAPTNVREGISRKQIFLVPMNREYIESARAAMTKIDENFDSSQPIEIDSEDLDFDGDVYIDAQLQFHQIEVSLDELGLAQVDPVKDERAVACEAEIESSPISESDVSLMKKTILMQLASPGIPNIKQSLLADPHRELHSVLARTVENGESHMVLLVGPHGLGKTIVIDKALEELKPAEGNTFITIKLSGSLHATEQHAVREIARQLDVALSKEESDAESTFERRAISDTFANILLTLEATSDAQKIAKYLKELPIRVIFIIDEIEKYTDTPKQMLLYNLFELIQNPKVPICIVGVTTKVNIRDLFEKRVRSRFSQRIITTQLAGLVEQFWENASAPLKIKSSESDQFSDKGYATRWNENLDLLFNERTPLRNVIYRCFFTTKSIGQIKHASMLPVSKVSARNPFTSADDFVVYPKFTADGVEAKVATCSRLELMMVVAAARWVSKSENSNVNFNLAYNEYVNMIKAHNAESTTLTTSGANTNTSHIDSLALAGIKVTRNITSARIMRDCWARLYRAGLLLDALTTSNEVNAHNNLNMYKEIVLEDTRTLEVDVLLEEVRALVMGDLLMERLTKL